LQHGYGVEEWSDGSKYQGYFEQSKKNGLGNYVWADSKQYVGQWRNN
jgi:hypothetical protein